MDRRGERVESEAERRRGGRVHTHGSVLLRTDGGGRGRVVDVSAGGVRFELAEGERASLVDEKVVLDLRLDGARQRWIRFGGRVLRAFDRTVVVAFFDSPPDFEDTIQDELVAELEHAAVEHVLLVDGCESHRVGLAARLRAAGHHVTEASTPLEAIAHLGESLEHPRIVLIAESSPLAIADELERYLGTAHLEVRLERVPS